MENLLYVAQSFKSSLDGRDFVHRLIVYPHFEMTLQFDSQLEIIRSIAPENRIAYIDSAGGFINLAQAEANMKYEKAINHSLNIKVIH